MQVSRYLHSHNIFIIILWDVAGISLRPFRYILPIIPYLVNFWSSPRLGLISLNHNFCRSINYSSVSIWTKWDHGSVDKTIAYNIPMCCGHFLQQRICVVGILFNKASIPLSSSGASLSLLGGCFFVAVQIWMRGTFGRSISSHWKSFWSG